VGGKRSAQPEALSTESKQQTGEEEEGEETITIATATSFHLHYHHHNRQFHRVRCLYALPLLFFFSPFLLPSLALSSSLLWAALITLRGWPHEACWSAPS